MNDQELLAAAGMLSLSADRQRSSQEQRAAAYLDRLAEQVRERAEVEAYVAGRRREHEAEQARQAELARIEAEDPRTTLEAPVVPGSDDDLVFLNVSGVFKAGSDDFRRDGRRHRYVGISGVPVGCPPKADFPELSTPYPAAQFDDLLGLYETAERAKAYTPLDPRPRDASPPLEWALAIVAACTDTRSFSALQRWHAFASKSELDGRMTLADRIVSHLARLGRRDLVIDEYAEIMNSSNGLGRTWRHDPPSYTGG